MNKEIEDLDPGSKKATERLNRLFCEENESIEDLSKEQLLWYLRTVLLWYDLEIDYHKSKQRDI